MRTTIAKRVAISVILVGLLALQTIGHPAYMTLFAKDPRSKIELRANCAICHSPDGRATEAGFLTQFGQEFKQNRLRITPAMRDRFTDLFNPPETPIQGGDADTIKLETSVVSINVTVTDEKGKLVTGLDREAFTVMEDGRPQDIVQIYGEDAPVAVAVIIDLSGSALTDDLVRWRNAVNDLGKLLKSGDVLAVYTLGEDGVSERKGFGPAQDGWTTDLKNLKPGGNSPLFDAVARAAADLKKRSERRRAIFVFSDGSDSGSETTLNAAEQQTFHSGSEIYVIDIINTQKAARQSAERQAAAQTLERMAVNTGGRYISADGFYIWGDRSKLKRLLSGLINELHNQYTLLYEPANARRAGRFRTIRVVMEQSDMAARARVGYRESVR